MFMLQVLDFAYGAACAQTRVPVCRGSHVLAPVVLSAVVDVVLVWL